MNTPQGGMQAVVESFPTPNPIEVVVPEGLKAKTAVKPRKTRKRKPKKKPEAAYNCSSHIYHFLKPNSLEKRIEMTCKALKRHKFDTIAFRGMSGALIAPPVARRLGKELVLVRKDNDNSHSDLDVEGYEGVKKYVILDDFICSGDTVNAIIKQVGEFAPKAEFIGMLSCLYLDEDDLKKYKGKLFPLNTIESDHRIYPF